MRGPYPGDLRVRVIEFVEAGGSRRDAAEHFEVSASSAIRWLQRFREDGTCEPMPRGGSASPLEKYSQQILALIGEQRDLTLNELRAAAHCRDSSRAIASRSKKSLQAEERKRADVARARRRWARANLPGEVAARAGYDFWGNQFRCHRAGGRRRRYSAAYRSPAEPADRSASRSECSFSAYFTPGSMRSARRLTPMKSPWAPCCSWWRSPMDRICCGE